MKKYYFLFYILISIVSNSKNAHSQNITNFKKKIFTFHNSKLSLGLGVDASESSWILNNTQPSGLNTFFKDPRKDSSYFSYISIGCTIDFYSPNSLLGLMIGGNYSFSDFSISDSRKVHYDYFSIDRLEIPAYIRIKPGARDATANFLIFIGGAYNFPLKGSRTQMSRGFGISFPVNNIDNSKEQFMPFYSASFSIGFDAFNGKKDNSRLSIYANAFIPLGNSLNSEYPEFIVGGNSPLAAYQDFFISQLRLGFGLRYFIGLQKYKY